MAALIFSFTLELFFIISFIITIKLFLLLKSNLSISHHCKSIFELILSPKSCLTTFIKVLNLNLQFFFHLVSFLSCIFFNNRAFASSFINKWFREYLIELNIWPNLLTNIISFSYLPCILAVINLLLYLMNWNSPLLFNYGRLWSHLWDKLISLFLKNSFIHLLLPFNLFSYSLQFIL